MNPNVSRREVVGGVVGGGLLLALGSLTGCGTRSATSALPGPRGPGEGALTGPALAKAGEPVNPSRTGKRSDDLGLPTGVVPRSQWTRAGVAHPSEINPMNGVNRITVHHDGMPPANLRTASDVAARLESIRQAHITRTPKRFADIGYHFIVDPQGRVWEGRSVAYQGAHVQDNNEHNLGVMVLGNFMEQRPTPQAVAALDRFVASQMARYNVPLSRVYTHQEIRQTDCPGRNLQTYMVQTRGRGGALAMAAAGIKYL